jgi:hypothetical protein
MFRNKLNFEEKIHERNICFEKENHKTFADLSIENISCLYLTILKFLVDLDA